MSHEEETFYVTRITEALQFKDFITVSKTGHWKTFIQVFCCKDNFFFNPNLLFEKMERKLTQV